MAQVLVIELTPREIECGMCCATVNNSHPDDRKAVPFLNGEPTVATGDFDGYKCVCPTCYGRWDAWNGRRAKCIRNISG